MIDYKIKNHYIVPLSLLSKDVKYSLGLRYTHANLKNYKFKKKYISKKRYSKAFKGAKKNMENGNSYLLNLTFPTKIFTNLTLDEIFESANAKFKLKFFDKFICFSPERFIKIKNNQIKTYPMKGTISASLPNAKKVILQNPKELAEHTMVVDLLRNDLSQIAQNVTVEKFRYIDKIKKGKDELLQVSSKITASLEKNWQNRLGNIIIKLLPAGSITGTPKLSTTKIIKKLEGYKRGYFTGVFGVFDGKNLDSAVMIRFIEKNGKKMVYKSGGGITIDSKLKEEYRELKEKVYLPF